MGDEAVLADLDPVGKASFVSSCAVAASSALAESRQMMAAHIVGNPATYSTIQAAVNAALAPRMIELAGEVADGAFLIKWIAPILRNLADTPERDRQLKGLGAKVYGISTDTFFTLKA